MADTVEITPGTGAVIGTDEVTIGGTLQQVQRVKLVDGTDGGTDLLPGTAGRGLAVDPRGKLARVAVTPTVSTSAYAAKDAVGSWMTFAGMARSAGAGLMLNAVQVVDLANVLPDMDLVLFDSDVSGTSTATDNAAFDPADADLDNVVAVVPIGQGYYASFNDNAVANVGGLGIEIVPTGTALYGVLVCRNAFTLASTADLVVTLTAIQR